MELTALVGRYGRTPLVLCIAAGLLAAQASLAWDSAFRDALGLGVRVVLACWALGITWVVGRAALRGEEVDRASWALAPVPNASWMVIALAGAVLIGVSLLRVPTRLLANLLGFGLVLGPIVWLVLRRSGPVAAAAAAAAVAAFGFVPGVVDRPAQPPARFSEAASTYMWSVGWPLGGWGLRQEVQIPPHLAGRPLIVAIPLAARYDGSARVRVTANGRDAGPARIEETGIYVPLAAVERPERLVLELWVDTPDPELRILAHRWVAGVSMGPSPSSYFDGQQWRPGTFNDATGTHQEGSLLVMVSDPA